MEKCIEHKWKFREQGFYDEEEETDEYEQYYCEKCLADAIVTFPSGRRSVEITEVIK